MKFKLRKKELPISTAIYADGRVVAVYASGKREVLKTMDKNILTEIIIGIKEEVRQSETLKHLQNSKKLFERGLELFNIK